MSETLEVLVVKANSECYEFFCEKLLLVVDDLDRVPHNIKIYNLSRIKMIGLKEWAKEASIIQEKYFKGKLVCGEAPSLS